MYSRCDPKDRLDATKRPRGPACHQETCKGDLLEAPTGVKGSVPLDGNRHVLWLGA